MMRAEDLIALAATAKGIDLKHIAGNASDTSKAHRRRRTHKEVLKGVPPITDSVSGVDERSTVRPSWSLQELGLAARGVSELHFMAARFTFAGDDSVFAKLWHELHFRAARLARHEDWPPQVRDVNGEPRFYVGELAHLVLIDERYRRYFLAAPALYSAFLHIEDGLWNRNVSKKFVAVKDCFDVWVEMARSGIEANLRAAAEEPNVA